MLDEKCKLCLNIRQESKVFNFIDFIKFFFAIKVVENENLIYIYTYFFFAGNFVPNAIPNVTL